MIHYMHLNEDPFNKIRRGIKTIELRLDDEKRRQISVGDTIIFSNEDHPDTELTVQVIGLYAFNSFEELYAELPLEKCGYTEEEAKNASPEDMKEYYSAEDISKWGVLGIEIELACVKDKKLSRISRFISLVLRHKPEAAGITLDVHGWADVGKLIKGISKKHPIDFETLEEIVRFDEKGRYSFDTHKRRIRANQGHSIPVDVELEKAVPPEVLYHGTGEKYKGSIEIEGLIPKTRLYVHLSADYDTAIKVGSRHGRPIVYKIDTSKMIEDGFEFFRSVNNVWLTKSVPAKYLSKCIIYK